VIVHFVDIDGIVDRICRGLFLFCVQWVKVRADCTFCWYWWNYWPSLFNFLFI